MDAVADQKETRTGDEGTRDRKLLAIVGELARELHPQHSRPSEPALSSRLERDLGIDSLGRTELVLRLERAFGVRLPIELVGSSGYGRLICFLPWSRRPAGHDDCRHAGGAVVGGCSGRHRSAHVARGAGVACRPASRPSSRHGAGGRRHRRSVRLTYGELAAAARTWPPA